MSAARGLLRDVRLRGVELGAADGRVVVDAPTGVLTDADRDRLRTARAELLAQLEAERRILDLPISSFGRERVAIELRLRDVPDSLWLVADAIHAAKLAAGGVAAGRIWTAEEMLQVLAVTRGDHHDLVRLVRVKAAFGARIVAAGPDDDTAVPGA